MKPVSITFNECSALFLLTEVQLLGQCRPGTLTTGASQSLARPRASDSPCRGQEASEQTLVQQWLPSSNSSALPGTGKESLPHGGARGGRGGEGSLQVGLGPELRRRLIFSSQASQ